MNKAMMLGAARYVRADNALENLEELKRYGRGVLSCFTAERPLRL